MPRPRLLGIASALVLSAACGLASAAPVGTAFTYQGELTKLGAPVNGTADLRFTLYTQSIGGSPLGTPQTISAVGVTDGLFSTQVDFGVNAYTTDQEYWLQIEVRNPAGGGAFSVLGARQRMSAAPYSMATRGISVNPSGIVSFRELQTAGSNGASFGVTDWAVGSGPTAGTQVVNQSIGNNAGPQFRFQSSFAASLFMDIGQNSTGDFVVEGNDTARMVVTNAGNVGIGTTTPAAALQIGPSDRLLDSPGGRSGGFITSGAYIGNTIGDNAALANFGYWCFPHSGPGTAPALSIHARKTSGASGWQGTSVGFTQDVDNTIGAGGSGLWFSNGSVGIGTDTPTRGKVEINGSAGLSGILNHGFFGPGGVAANIASFAGATSLHATGDIHAWVFRAFSDARIKNIVGRSDAAKDLDTLQKIEITDYTFKDTIGKGAEPQKKVIGQQVEAVYPLAVRKTSDIIPDIYKKAPVQGGWVMLTTDLKVGDKVRVIGMDEQTESTVAEVKDGGFRVTDLPAGDEVFVYGREVSDFLNVDYEAIAMLNVSATQELARQTMAQQQRIEALEAEIKELKSESSLSARIEKLEALLAASNERTASK